VPIATLAFVFLARYDIQSTKNRSEKLSAPKSIPIHGLKLAKPSNQVARVFPVFRLYALPGSWSRSLWDLLPQHCTRDAGFFLRTTPPIYVFPTPFIGSRYSNKLKRDFLSGRTTAKRCLPCSTYLLIRFWDRLKNKRRFLVYKPSILLPPALFLSVSHIFLSH
jgi:hypothetical protein